MPTCPNCGSYIPLGDHSCSCGTTISYDYDEEDESIDWYEIRKKRQNENPYEDDFFNELHHQFVSPVLIDNMNRKLTYLKKKFNAKLDDVKVMGNVAIFRLKVHEKYYDAVFRANFDMSNAFNDMNLLKQLVIPDFTRLYQNSEFQKVVKQKEKETGFEFRFCKLAIIDDSFLVDAHFENRSYLVDLDEMKLIS